MCSYESACSFSYGIYYNTHSTWKCETAVEHLSVVVGDRARVAVRLERVRHEIAEHILVADLKALRERLLHVTLEVEQLLQTARQRLTNKQTAADVSRVKQCSSRSGEGRGSWRKPLSSEQQFLTCQYWLNWLSKYVKVAAAYRVRVGQVPERANLAQQLSIDNHRELHV